MTTLGSWDTGYFIVDVASTLTITISRSSCVESILYQVIVANKGGSLCNEECESNKFPFVSGSTSQFLFLQELINVRPITNKTWIV